MERQRQILHIDMNSFFASCEQAVNPKLREAPLIVGGDPERRSGIVLAASYDAKKFGVRTTMSLHEAARLCPTAVIVKPTNGLYERMSKNVMEIFDQYTPTKEQVSIDEAFLDMTGSFHIFGDVISVAKEIQQRILKELDLPCSVGISSNKLLAKMASDYKKPMGITTIYPHEMPQKLWPQDISNLYGVGKKTVPKLRAIGIDTIGDLAKADKIILVSHFGESTADMLLRHANGVDDSPVSPEVDEIKSVGNEITFPKDFTSNQDLLNALLFLSDKVGFRLRKKMLKGRTINIKVKYNDFSVITRAKTIRNLTDQTDVIYDTAKELLLQNWTGKPIRLLGVTVSNFEEEDIKQISLFDDPALESKSKADQMVDEIRNKFGYDAIGRASIFHKKIR